MITSRRSGRGSVRSDLSQRDGRPVGVTSKNHAEALDWWLVAILLMAGSLFVVNLSWGLPNGNSSWAADAIGPVTSIGIVYRSFSEWNSGWYYFKYPLAWPFILFLATSPYLVWLYLVGGWRSPTTEYPYGFEDPEQALFVLAILGRCVNVLFSLGTVAVTYGIANRLCGRAVARIAAFLVATAYPIIYYAHTSNLDASYLFWLLLAVYAAIVCSQATTSICAWLALGAAAALAVSSKEQGFAFLLPLPMLSLAPAFRLHGWRALISREAFAMSAAAIGAAVLANNVLFNPYGFVSRIAYLLGQPFEEVSVRLAPVEFALWKGAKEWVYIRQLWDGLESTLGIPVLILGAAGLLVAWRRNRRALVWLIAPVFAHYYLSLRGLELITVRYLLPVSVIVTIFAALPLVEAWSSQTSAVRNTMLVIGVLMCLYGGARAVDLHHLLAGDPRYDAEIWIEANGKEGDVLEHYQKSTFLPRLRGVVSGRFVKMEDRTLDGLSQRRPWGVVLSSASDKSIAHMWNPDWRETRNMLKPVAAAQELHQAIIEGESEYRKAASFRIEPKLIRSRITSVAPEIVIYVRQ